MKRSSSAHTHLQRADGRWKSVLSACEVVSELRAGNGSAFFRVKEEEAPFFRREFRWYRADAP